MKKNLWTDSIDWAVSLLVNKNMYFNVFLNTSLNVQAINIIDRLQASMQALSKRPLKRRLANLI